MIIANWCPDADKWKAYLKQMIATAKGKTDQIIVQTPTPGEPAIASAKAISAALLELVKEEKVAAADITKMCTYRGEPYAYAGEGNEWHPTYELHIQMAEMIAPLLTGEERLWPEAPAKK